MTAERLALIESNTSGTGRLFVRAAAAAGYRPLLLSADPDRYGYVAEDGIDVLRTDTSSRRALVDACRRVAQRDRLAGVTSSSDYFIDAAASVAASLGLPGPEPEAMRIVRDKQAQRTRLAAAGVAVPTFRAARTVAGAVAAARTLGFPVVVKPVRGSGSVGVKLCGDARQVAAHAGRLLRTRRNERGQPIPARVLVEEMAVGPEYSVETFDRTIVGVTNKHLGSLPDFVEVGHDYPAVVSGDVRGTLARNVQRALAALGLGWGPAHVELRVTDGGPTIIEVNPRLCGGYIPELVRLASGIDLIAASVTRAVGGAPALAVSSWRYASIRFVVAPGAGTLARVRGVARARQARCVADVMLYRRRGEHVTRHGDFRDRIAHVIAVAPTAARARGAAERAREALVVELAGER